MVATGVALLLISTACSDNGRVARPTPPSPSRPRAAASDASIGASGSPVDSFSARLTWHAPPGSASIQIWRDSRLIDRVASTASSYVDYLLWQKTTYHYIVAFVDTSGKSMGAYPVRITTPPRSGPFPRLYAPTSFWNTPIPPSPEIDPNSTPIIANSIVRYARNANLVNTSTHAYPIAYADPSSSAYAIGCTKYDCQTSVSFPVPTYARANSGPDRHLIVIDPSTSSELDMFGASCCWTASSRYVTETNGWGALCPQGQHCNGAVAAGFAEAGGVIRPEEILQGSIDHAIALATPYTRAGFIACPATHTDGKYSVTAIPEGARIQLDPGFNVAGQKWPAWEKVIARALQVYGAYIVDTSGSLAIRGEGNQTRGYNAWAKAGVPGVRPTLSNLPWSRFRLLKLTQC